MSNILRGKKIMCYLKGSTNSAYHAVGFATNHTFSTSASTVSISHKDLEDTATGTAKWAAEDIDTLSWSIQCECFYANTAEGYTVADLMAIYVAGTELDVKWGLASASITGAPTGGWVPGNVSGDMILSGKAVITSIDIQAPVDGEATASLTLTGKGGITIGSTTVSSNS